MGTAKLGPFSTLTHGGGPANLEVGHSTAEPRIDVGETMVSSTAQTTDAYLAELNESTRSELIPVLRRVRATVPAGFVEEMDYGMITWSVPLAIYPDTYNKRPLLYAGLAAQKRYNSLYLSAACTCVGGRLDADAIARGWSGGRPLDMGKSCVRFRKAADLDLDLIAEVLGQWTIHDFVAFAKEKRTGSGRGDT
jgi:hypothetical protein